MSPVKPNHQQNAYRLLTIIQGHAEIGSQQMAVAAVYNKALADGASYQELTATMATILSDGLNHGNWPWTGAKS